MSMSERARKQLKHELVVGLFFIIAMIILGYVTIILGPSSFLDKNEVVTIAFEDVGALKRGDSIRVRGVKFGKVIDMDINGDYSNVDVVANLTHDLVLYRDYKISIHSSSVLGGQYMKIDVGTKKTGVYDYRKEGLKGYLPGDFLSEAGDGLKSAGNFFSTAEELVIGLKEDRTYLNKTLKNFAAVSDKVKSGEGTVGRLLMKDDLYKEIQSTMDTLKKAGAAVEKNVAEFGNASKELKTFGEKLNKGEGTLQKLLTDDKIYKDLSASSENVKNFTAKLGAKDSSLTRLMSDKGALYKDLEASFANIKEVSEKINTGEGTLAQLINKSTLHKEAEATFAQAKKALKEVEHAIQDFREQAPVSTFGGILLKGL